MESAVEPDRSAVADKLKALAVQKHRVLDVIRPLGLEGRTLVSFRCSVTRDPIISLREEKPSAAALRRERGERLESKVVVGSAIGRKSKGIYDINCRTNVESSDRSTD